MNYSIRIPFLSLFLTTALFILLVGCQQGFYRNTENGDSSSVSVESGEPRSAELETPDSSGQTDPSLSTEPLDEAGESVGIPRGRIAYIDLDGQLTTVSPEGKDRRILSNSDTFFQFPAWSPAGNRIATIGTGQDESGVYMFVDEEDREALSLYKEAQHSAPIYLYWRPDGERVSFIARNGRELAFYLVPADASTESEILAEGQPFYWQWLSNNKQALIHVGSNRLSFLDLEGNEEITGLGRNGIFQAPAISSDLSYFAYQQNTTDGRLVQIKNLFDDEIVYEANHTGVLAMSWHPSQNQLVFNNPQNNGSFIGPLLIWRASTGEISTLVTEDVISFFWSPDGRFIAFFTTDTIDRQASSSRMRTASLSTQRRPFLTVGIAEIESGTIRYLTRFEPPPIFISQFLPFFDQYALSHRIWSPDSDSIVLPSVNNSGTPEIVVFSVSGESPRIVGEGISAFWSHQ